ncbi:MAG: 5-(carboxyamino)imidazole ribonucleotide mutase [Candidatus Doudnabacteria bacterium CG10_big_fil_rev_8_21_14_0_10_41_10]|uniref:5-(Carboxyamino)imidazole ribonucleotide mutase n=1 Tax=Candidatus Doudnabacteria bacterium CG10_big_fil_rev_8_21_14_0_10_41_10 TaxID=1974551 RepID=A0A2H0VEC5_9BACT|nr:MAG: 5-(carboxyamino)imidazole ribonucleotide mutase [Candidatus Doudnabacteria bacterium CG10_big_fil_rev_8_21_14_0_10_41_10]
MKVVFIIASPSDEEWAKKIKAKLADWGLDHVTHIASAHKVPEKVFEIVQKYNKDQQIVYVTIAGRSNGLSAVVAANSIHPVIACPPFTDKIDMIVNVNSTLQMPSDTPVLTVLDPGNVAAAVSRIFGLADKDAQQKVSKKINDIKSKYE